jgi:hypothetical protein
VRIPFALSFTAILILVFSGCGPQPEFDPRPVPATHMSTVQREVAQLSLPVSVNNLWLETQTIKLNGRKRIPRVVNTKHPNYRIGRSDRFWVLNALNDHYALTKATILCETPHLYLYVARGVHVPRADCWRSARTFEHSTYPTDHRVFGSEWSPGVANDTHITLFYGPVPGVAGYFSGEDEYPRMVNRYSNQRNIFFIDSSSASLGTSAFTSTAAHEFQHMINWHVHPQNEAWSNEGASMLAQVVNGFSADQVDSFYQGQPVQLDSWSNGNNTPNYGAGFLWMDYLYERFGASFIHEMMADNKYSGLQLAAHVLKLMKAPSLSHVFGDWAVANYLNDHHLGSRFSYRNSNIHMPNTATLGPGTIGYKANIHPYLPNYLSIKLGNGPRTLRFHGSSTINLISGSQPDPYWWSNRCDFCQTSMTRSVDLGRSHRPVLTFKAWYGIEKLYDYAYVEVSTDRGVSWRTQPSNIGTNSNPNGGNFGNGITGQSWRLPHNSAEWLPVRVNLAKFQGRHILLRFQYITDDEYNGQSLAVRDIAIRAAHYMDRVGDPHWRLSGFVPALTNRLPMRWSLRLIAWAGHLPIVKTIPVSASGVSTIKISPGRHDKRATLVVYGEAPKTTNSSAYVLTG